MKMISIARMGWRVFVANLTGSAVPLNIMLSVTNRCNGGCTYCRIPERGGDELSLGQIELLIDQLVAQGCQRLGIWGGEPLLREDISDIVRYAKRAGLFVTMDSNGFLLPKRQDILDSLDHLVLAFDGDEKAHDANRGKGAFQKTMPAIRLASGQIPLWSITVLTKHNMASVDYILKTAEAFGFLSTFQVLHHNAILAGDCRDIALSDKEQREVVSRIIAAKKRGAPVASSYNYLEHLLRWEDFSAPRLARPIKGVKCRAGKLFGNVDTSGAVFPCSLLVGEIPSRNFLEAGFQKAFEACDRGRCNSCIASCYTEYNYLYSLNPLTALEWTAAMIRSQARIRRD